jgi:hypothetical protein
MDSTVRTALRALVMATIAVAWARGVHAQDQPRWPSLLEQWFEQGPQLELTPGLVWWSANGTRHRLDARIAWARDAAYGREFELALLLGHAGPFRRSYSWSGVSAHVPLSERARSLWFDAMLAAGTGAGPRTVVALAAGGKDGMLAFEVRTTWFQQDASVDTATLVPLRFSPTAGVRDGRYTDAALALQRQFSVFDAGVHTGYRFGGPTRGAPQWLWAEAGVALLQSIGLRVSAGSRPERPELAQTGGRFASFAIEWRSAHRAMTAAAPAPDSPPEPPIAGRSNDVDVVALDGGRYRIRFLLPDAQRVELHGDVTDWTSVSLHRVTGTRDTWEIILVARPGAYTVRLRVDGGDWFVPETLVAVPDGFGGSAGILTLPGT